MQGHGKSLLYAVIPYKRLFLRLESVTIKNTNMCFYMVQQSAIELLHDYDLSMNHSFKPYIFPHSRNSFTIPIVQIQDEYMNRTKKIQYE